MTGESEAQDRTVELLHEGHHFIRLSTPAQKKLQGEGAREQGAEDIETGGLGEGGACEWQRALAAHTGAWCATAAVCRGCT